MADQETQLPSAAEFMKSQQGALSPSNLPSAAQFMKSQASSPGGSPPPSSSKSVSPKFGMDRTPAKAAPVGGGGRGGTPQGAPPVTRQEQTLNVAPPPGPFTRLKEAIMGSPQEGDTPIGRKFGITYEAPNEQHVPTTDLPLIRATALDPGKPTSVAGGIAKGALGFAEGMTTAPNLLMMAGGGLIGAAGKISSLLPRAVGAAFSVDMLKSAYDQYPEVKAKIDANDWPGAAEAITKLAATGSLAVLSGVHSVKGVTEDLRSERNTTAPTPPGAPLGESRETSVDRRAAIDRARAEAARNSNPAEPRPKALDEPPKSIAQLQAEVERLRTENAKLKAKQDGPPGATEVKPKTAVKEAKPFDLGDGSAEQIRITKENEERIRKEAEEHNAAAERLRKANEVINRARAGDPLEVVPWDTPIQPATVTTTDGHTSHTEHPTTPKIIRALEAEVIKRGLVKDEQQIKELRRDYAGSLESGRRGTSEEYGKYLQDWIKRGTSDEKVDAKALPTPEHPPADELPEVDPTPQQRAARVREERIGRADPWFGDERATPEMKSWPKDKLPTWKQMVEGYAQHLEKHPDQPQAMLDWARDFYEGKGTSNTQGNPWEGPVQKRIMAKPEETAPPETAPTPVSKVGEKAEESMAPAEQGRKPNPSVTLGSGLGALDPAFEKFDKYLKTSYDEMKAEYEKRNEAKKAEKSLPETNDAQRSAGDEALHVLTGGRDEWEVTMNQIGDRVDQVMPDIEDKQALIMLRQLNGRPEIAKIYDGTHPAFEGMTTEQRAKVDKALAVTRPWYERALKMKDDPAIRASDALYTAIATDTLQEGSRLGNLPGSRFTNDEYVPTITVPLEEAALPKQSRENIGRLMGGRAGKYFEGAPRRDYLTYAHAALNGEIPVTGNIVDLFNLRAEQFAVSKATHSFENYLKHTKQGQYYNSPENVPEGWVPFAPHTQEFRRTIDTGKNGQEGVTLHQQLYVPPYIAEALRPVTDPNFMAAFPGWKKTQNFQQWIKMANVSLSAFHPLKISMRALFTLGPKGMLDAWDKGFMDESMRSVERLAASRGLKTPAQGGAMKAILNMLPMRTPTVLDVASRAPLVNKVVEYSRELNHFTFDFLTRNYKVGLFAAKDAAWIAKHPDATPEQLQAAQESIAKFANAQFGGLHWENLGVNRATVDMMRMLSFAPDWFISKYLTVKYATEGTAESGEDTKGFLKKAASLGKATAHQAASAVGAEKLVSPSWEGAPAGNIARQYWALKISTGLIATQLLSRLYTGKSSPHPTQVYMGKDRDGNDKYSNLFFADADENAIRLIDNTAKHGAIEGLQKTLDSQDSNLMRAYMHIAENRDERGRVINQPGMDPLASTARSLWQLSKDLDPLPIVTGGEYDIWFGPERGKYSTDEGAWALLGQRVMHVPPAKPKGKPGLSIWDQIRTGDVHPVKHRNKGRGAPP